MSRQPYPAEGEAMGIREIVIETLRPRHIAKSRSTPCRGAVLRRRAFAAVRACAALPPCAIQSKQLGLAPRRVEADAVLPAPPYGSRLRRDKCPDPLLIYGLLSSFLRSGTLEPSLLHSALSPSQTKPSRSSWGLGHGARHLRSASSRRWGEACV
ncbi:unnamed protein product [Urochloa humidicola]